MRVYYIAALLYPMPAIGSPADYNVLSALAPQTPTVSTSGPGLIPTSVHLAPTFLPENAQDGLELRQVAASPSGIMVVAVNSPVPARVAPAEQPAAAVSPISSPLAAPVPAHATSAVSVAPTSGAVPSAPPAAFLVSPPRVTTTAHLPSLVAGDDFVSIQWVEAYVSGLRAWSPKAQTFHYEAMSQAPPHGAETIGTESLTEQTGQTHTIYMVAGAAPTPAAGSKKALAAAVAVGIAGFVV